MNTKDLIKHYGDRRTAMFMAGVPSLQLWEYWQNVGIPHGRQLEIQLFTKGKLKAGPKKKRKHNGSKK